MTPLVMGGPSTLTRVALALRAWSRTARGGALALIRVVLRVLLSTLGLALMVAAAWVGLGLWAGLLAGGVACLVLEWMVRG